MKGEKTNFKNEALAIAFLTFTGYVAAFFSQFGYFYYYNLPVSLISISTETVLLSIFYVFLVVFFFMGISDLVASRISYKSIVFKNIVINLLIILVTTFLIIIFNPDVFTLWFVIIVVCLIIYLSLIQPLIKYRTFSLEKALRFTLIESKESKVHLFEVAMLKLSEKFGINLLLPVICIITVGLISSIFSYSTARLNYNYLTINDIPGFAIVIIDNKRIIGVQYNNKTKVLENSYSILPLEHQDKALKLEYKNIGQLKRKELPTKNNTTNLQKYWQNVQSFFADKIKKFNYSTQPHK